MIPISTATVYWQRFYTQHSLSKYDAFHMGQACLFLASKVEESPKKLEDLVVITHPLGPRTAPPPRRRLGATAFQGTQVCAAAYAAANQTCTH